MRGKFVAAWTGIRILKPHINVTPLVDVMLVLLIIMMLIALLAVRVFAQRGGTAGARYSGTDGRGRRRATILREHAAGTPEDLIPRVSGRSRQKDKIVYVKGDKDATCTAIMDAMDALRKAQIECRPHHRG